MWVYQKCRISGKIKNANPQMANIITQYEPDGELAAGCVTSAKVQRADKGDKAVLNDIGTEELAH